MWVCLMTSRDEAEVARLGRESHRSAAGPFSARHQGEHDVDNVSLLVMLILTTWLRWHLLGFPIVKSLLFPL